MTLTRNNYQEFEKASDILKLFVKAQFPDEARFTIEFDMLIKRKSGSLGEIDAIVWDEQEFAIHYFHEYNGSYLEISGERIALFDELNETRYVFDPSESIRNYMQENHATHITHTLTILFPDIDSTDVFYLQPLDLAENCKYIFKDQLNV